jgi:hypothetical protein
VSFLDDLGQTWSNIADTSEAQQNASADFWTEYIAPIFSPITAAWTSLTAILKSIPIIVYGLAAAVIVYLILMGRKGKSIV